MGRMLKTKIVGYFADRLSGPPQKRFRFIDHPQMNVLLGGFAGKAVEQIGQIVGRKVQFGGKVLNTGQARLDQGVPGKIVVQQSFKMLHEIVAHLRAGVKLTVVEPVAVIEKQLNISGNEPQRVLVDVLGIFPLDLVHTVADHLLFVLGNVQCFIDIVVKK